jgi:hypothetical protein
MRYPYGRFYPLWLYVADFSVLGNLDWRLANHLKVLAISRDKRSMFLDRSRGDQ